MPASLVSDMRVESSDKISITDCGIPPRPIGLRWQREVAIAEWWGTKLRHFARYLEFPVGGQRVSR